MTAGKGTVLGIGVLISAYVLSQFYRAFLSVLTPDLAADVGATPETLAYASGMWFLTFAAMQIPIGWALDTYGPRRPAAILLLVGGGGGAALFGMAAAPWQIIAAMGLIGIGCAPVLMASYYTFARLYSPAIFATLAASVVGVGSLGNIAASVPMVWAAETLGWRASLFALAGVTAGIAALIHLLVVDPPKVESETKGSVLDLLRIPALWFVLPMIFVNYVPAAAIRGSWIGPYGEDVLQLTQGQIGTMTLVMALAMVLGNFVYGPLDRLLGTRKWVCVAGNFAGALCCAALWAFPAPGLWTATLLTAAVGFFGASYAVLMAHGRAFCPPHLTGRAVTLLNMFSIGGVGLLQFASGGVFRWAEARAATPEAAYSTLFGFFALLLLAGVAIYAFGRDRTD